MAQKKSAKSREFVQDVMHGMRELEQTLRAGIPLEREVHRSHGGSSPPGKIQPQSPQGNVQGRMKLR
jgi:hypothetical protein